MTTNEPCNSCSLYIVKTRLQGAVDGAALAAAKALSRGNDSATQISNAKLDAATSAALDRVLAWTKV